MPFDPELPADHAQVRAGELRGQFNGLKEQMDSADQSLSARVDDLEVTRVTQEAFENQSANNIADLQTLGFDLSDPPTRDELVAMKEKIDELILKLRR